jgi:hypothetical protein
MVPVVHHRVVLGIRVKIAPAEASGCRVVFGTAKVATRAAEAVVQGLAPSAALVMNVPFVRASAVTGKVVIGSRSAKQAAPFAASASDMRYLVARGPPPLPNASVSKPSSSAKAPTMRRIATAERVILKLGQSRANNYFL